MWEKIKRELGDDMRPFHYTIGGTSREGWRTRARPSDKEGIERSAAVLRSDDIRVFLGDGGSVKYALPGLPALDIIELMRVGSHNDAADWRDVRRVLERAETPFDIVFADEAGLEAVFHHPIEEAKARALVQGVLDHEWFDSIAAMAEAGDEGEDAAGEEAGEEDAEGEEDAAGDEEAAGEEDAEGEEDAAGDEEAAGEEGDDPLAPLAQVVAYIVGRNRLTLWWD